MNGLHRTILSSEARLGGKIFENADSATRQFYCLDATTWVLRQESSIVFYKVNPTNIYKSADGVNYRLVGREEAARLSRAAKIYQKLIETKVYDSLLALR